ncbi:MAG: hypothetical protein JXM70_08185 [Pirellulales bacterium]|nr:hypothetical protein [Pirellulales bacterium]
MSRVPIAILCVILSLSTWQTAQSAAPVPPAARWIPQNALIAIDISNPKALIDLAFNPQIIAKVKSVPAYKQITSKPDVQQLFGLFKFLEASLGTDWPTALKKSTGGGITLAACPDDISLIIIDAQDGKMLARLHKMFLNIAKDDAKKKGQPNRVRSAVYRDVTGWTFNGKETHALIGNRLIFANKSKGLINMLDLRADGGAKSLYALPAYQAAKKASSTGTIASAFVNMGVLKHVPPITKVLANNQNPLATLLFGGVTEALQDSNWLALGLGIKGNTLSLHATVDGKTDDPNGAASFAFPDMLDKGALPNLVVPRRIAAMSIWRDLRAFYAAKDDFFPERTSALIFFENMMGIFFSGRDLTEDVLAETHPQVRIVVAEQTFAHGTPPTKLPAFAAVFQLRNPEKFALVAEEAWQKAIGLINFTRGQQAQAGMIIRQPTHNGTTYTMAYFLPGEKDAEMQIYHNFRPSLATIGNSLILSSTDELAEDLIDSLKKQRNLPPKALPSTNSVVELDTTALASILAANRDILIRNNIVEKGNTPQKATFEIDLLLTIIQNLGRMNLSLENRHSLNYATLQWTLN